MALPPGHSGYFSTPADQLDPDLFEPGPQPQHLQPAVRHWLLIVLSQGLQRYLHLTGVDNWLHAWLAGSGITYQWAGDRGNGDLDVLFGVDMPEFTRFNPEFSGLPESYVAAEVNGILKERMWPVTVSQRFGRKDYEVTFFWNPGTGRDIRAIHPYAAYDLMADAWVVLPPGLPHDPRTLYPGEWFRAADRDIDGASQLVNRHSSLREQLASRAGDTSQARNAGAELARVQQAAMSLFDEIHGGRREAFGEQGHGYTDFANFRWQRAKETGVVAGLRDIITRARAESLDRDQQAYGGPIDGPGTLITRAMLNRRPQ